GITDASSGNGWGVRASCAYLPHCLSLSLIIPIWGQVSPMMRLPRCGQGGAVPIVQTMATPIPSTLPKMTPRDRALTPNSYVSLALVVTLIVASVYIGGQMQ